MGRIQNLRMERAKQAFKEQMDPSDRARAFYIDYAGNVVGFSIERADGNTLYYNGETGYYQRQPLLILPEDKVENIPPYEYKDGKIVSCEKPEPSPLNDIIASANLRATRGNGGQGDPPPGSAGAIGPEEEKDFTARRAPSKRHDELSR